MDAGFEAHLQVGDVTFDRSDAALLRAIDTHRSMNAAAAALGRSYSRSHRRITELESAVGPLVTRTRGGRDGGGSALTADAWELLARFRRLQAALKGTTQTAEAVLEGTVVDRDGEVVTVETPAGPVRSLLFEPATDVQVTFRADAVTLHPPDTAPSDDETSALNRFRGTVVAIDKHEAIAEVTIEIDDESPPVRVVITRESLSNLELGSGTPVIASFKATAARATPK